MKLARLYDARRMVPQAEYLYKSTLTINIDTFGEQHLEVAKVMEELSGFYRKIGKQNEANWLQRRAEQIRSAKQ